LNKSQANLEVVKKENGSILFEKDYSSQYDGFDPYSPEGNIIFSLYQNAFLNQSLQLADLIQKQFTNKLYRHNRGVKQAGFLVLYKTTMPAALVELGFLSNPQEEEYLISENGQNQLASAIYRAFKEYKTKFEGGTMIDDTDMQPDNIVKFTNQKDSIPINYVAIDTSTKQIKASKKEIFFRVQFATSSVKKSLNSPEFKGLSDIRIYIHNSIYKYTSGNYTTIDDAVNYQHEVQQKGFQDAFVVAFFNEHRITPAEAIKIISQ
jgi:N-acetylmuramoyl-L-alanine amidase